MNIAVYLGSRYGNDPAFADGVKTLGAWIAQNGHTLVYGGSNVGLMGGLSDAVKENGGRIIGIGLNVERILSAKRTDLDEYYEAKSVQERKKLMMDISDAFIAVPGSLGTLDEITDIMAVLKLEIISKPGIIYNINGFYDPLAEMLNKMKENGFLFEEEIKNIFFVKDFGELSAILNR